MADVALVAVPEHFRRLSGLDPGYQEALAMDTAVELTPVEWARLGHGTGPPVLRAALHTFFSILSGRLPWTSAPAQDPDWLLPGWELLQGDSEAAVLGFDDPLGYRVRTVVSAPPGQCIHATLVEFTRPSGRVAWRFMARGHRTIVGRLMRNARRLAVDG